MDIFRLIDFLDANSPRLHWVIGEEIFFRQLMRMQDSRGSYLAGINAGNNRYFLGHPVELGNDNSKILLVCKMPDCSQIVSEYSLLDC